MPILGNALDFAKYEARNLRAHILSSAPSSPVTSQLYYNSVDNTLYWWDSTTWVTARGGTAPDATTSSRGLIQLTGDLAGTATSPQIAAGVITDADVNSANKDGAAGTASMRTLGTGAQQAASGTDTRFTDSRAPNGAAGGDLSGTYPSPNVIKSVGNFTVGGQLLVPTSGAVAGLILGGDVNLYRSSADLLKTDDIFAVGSGLLFYPATFGIMSVTAAGNHVLRNFVLAGDTIPALRIAGDGRIEWGVGGTTVADTNLYRSAADTLKTDDTFSAPKVTGLADPTGATDAANKQYVDNTTQGLDAKQSVRAASTANLTLSGTQTVDDVALVANDRVLVKDQTTASANGIYVVAAGAWTRATDVDTWNELISAYVWVEQGTANVDSGWVSTVDQGGTLNTTNVTWVQFAGAGQVIAGAGLTKTANTLDVGAGSGISVAADTVAVATGGVSNAMLAGGIDATTKLTGAVPVVNGGTGQATAKAARETGLGSAGYYSSATHGAGTTITITQSTHGLRASRGLIVQVQDEATGAVEFPDAVVAATGDVTVTYGASVSANAKRITVIG